MWTGPQTECQLLASEFGITVQTSKLVCGHCLLELELGLKVGSNVKLCVCKTVSHFLGKRVAKGQEGFNLSSEYC